MLRPDWHGGGTVLAIGFAVNSTADTPDGFPGDFVCDTGFGPNDWTGICTLRAAIEEANASAGPHAITFTFAGTIQPLTELPAITMSGVTIDGDGDIVLDGSSAGAGANGLVIQTSNTTVKGLVINGFQVTNLAGNDFSKGNGVVIRTGTGNIIAANFIGTNAAGTACVGNGGSGVLIGGSNSIGAASNNTVGGTNAADRNVITCNGFQNQTVTGWDGVTIWATSANAANSNVVQGNYIGTDVTGAMTLTAGTDISGTIHIGNTGNGVRIAGGSSNTVGGTSANARNILSGNELAGVRIEASPVFTREANSNVVQGNYIGTDVNGTGDLGNLDVGVYIIGLVDDADSNQIGGTDAGAGNLISGNGASGVFILGGKADHNTVSGNRIGTDVNGTAAMPNDSGGVMITDAMTNTIGGTTAAARNLISGNAGIGVSIINSDDDGDADGNLIQGNYIGTEVSGTTALPNTLTGVVITNAANNDVGGTAAGAGNLISGNGEYGVIIMNSGATGNVVQDNYIGTDFDGDAAIPNQGAGVLIVNASGNTVGGSGNLISGNVLQGVRLIGADNNTVRDNLIGTQADGTSPLGNGSHGVVIADGDNNVIGVDGVTPQDNTIAHNGGDGVLVYSGTGNQILSNSIFDNTELGIDLGDDNVVTPNDEDDPDTGANNLQNYPVLTTVTTGSTDLQGALLNSTPNTLFTIQVFTNTVCDASGFGEGQTYLGSTTVETGGDGNKLFDVSFTTTVPDGQFLTATATDPYSNTSEFSNCIPVPSAPVLAINKEWQDLNGGAALPGDTLLYTINYSNTGNAPATGVVITDTYSISCTAISNVTTDLNFTTFFSDTTRIRWPATGGIVLDAQAGGSVSYRCTLDDSFPDGITNVENTATIDSDQTAPLPDTETVPVDVEAVLTIDKECTPAMGNRPGDTVRCVIQYANTGHAYATGATIVDDYDENYGDVPDASITGSAHFGVGTDDSNTITWGPSTIPAGESGQVEYDYTLAVAGTFPHGTTPVMNTATIDSNDTDPVADPETIQVTAAAVLTINKQALDPNGGLAEPGDILQYTIHYTNTGDAQATGVFITDDYSDLCAISGVTTDANFTTFSNISGVLRWPQNPNMTTLAAGASGSLSYECQLQDPFPAGTTRVSNTSTIDSNETGPKQDTETLFTACYDFNGNGVVDIGDIMQVAVRWGIAPGDPDWDDKYDVNGDGAITILDIMMVAAQWGQAC